MTRRAWLLLLGPLAGTLALASCGPPPPPPPAVLQLTIKAGANQNPQSNGQPAPVGVRLYQLTASATFQQAGVYPLLQQEAPTLGQELLAAETIDVSPGQTVTVERQLKIGAQFLGAAVLFRDIDHAQWRAVAPLAASGPTKLTLTTNALQMTLAP